MSISCGPDLVCTLCRRFAMSYSGIAELFVIIARYSANCLKRSKHLSSSLAGVNSWVEIGHRQ